VEKLTTEKFKEQIWDFEKEKEWKYKGKLPCILDFYADWCAPCKFTTPILEELNEKYKDKIEVFSIDVDQESELSKLFNIRSIPTFLFIPINDKPEIAVGGLPKNVFENAIRDVLKINNDFTTINNRMGKKTRIKTFNGSFHWCT